MKKLESFNLWLIAIILIAFVGVWTVVSRSQIADPGSVVPMATAMTPADGTAAVALNEAITVTFSQQMSAHSMAACLILLRPDGTQVPGGVNTVFTTSMFRPSVNLAPNTTYTAKVRPEAADLAGVSMGQPFVWTFTTGMTTDTISPTVISTNPANTDTGVQIGQRIIAVFNEGMSPGSLNTTSFLVTKPGGSRVQGVVSYTSGAATFRPIYGLSINSHYIATITTGAKDLANNPMAANYVWSFDTGPTGAVVRPTVTSTNPANNALQVPVDQKVNATFSKAMNYSTITTADFTLSWSGGNVVGTITYFYDATNKVTIATFVPRANLLINTVYTARITNEAQDLSSNALVGNRPSGNYVWQFTTGSATGQAPVPLGAAANFAVLAAATVTNTSTPTTVTGDVGIWPGTSMTGFPPGIVNGAIHVNDTTSQAAEAALTIAYNNAAGRVGPFTLAAGNVGGLTFTPGLYRSLTSTEISGGGNLTLDAQGDPNAVFIFQISQTLTTSSGYGITLINGAKPSQIFWEVGSSATIGMNTHFAGTILANTSITLVSGAVLDGRALAGAISGTGAVTMDDNTVVKPTP